jgi:hypothetical protein
MVSVMVCSEYWVISAVWFHYLYLGAAIGTHAPLNYFDVNWFPACVLIFLVLICTIASTSTVNPLTVVI